MRRGLLTILFLIMMCFIAEAQHIKSKVHSKATNGKTVKLNALFTKNAWCARDSIGSNNVLFYKRKYGHGLNLDEREYHFYRDNTYTEDYRLDCEVVIGHQRIPYTVIVDTLNIVSNEGEKYKYLISQISADTISMECISK